MEEFEKSFKSKMDVNSAAAAQGKNFAEENKDALKPNQSPSMTK